ncbi:MAG: oligosaccharide flippase family protein [Pseudomonadota bacterium]
MVAGASAYLVAGRVWSQAASLLMMLVAVRVLEPAEFGAYALVGTTVLMVQLAAEGGWYEYAARGSKNEQPPPELFWCTLGAGLFGWLIVMLCALVVYLFFQAPKYAGAMAILSTAPLFGTVYGLQFGMHTRNQTLFRIPSVLIPAELIGLIVGVAGLLSGMGVTALAIQKAVVGGILTVGVVSWGGWIAPVAFSVSRAKSVLKYVFNFSASRIIALTRSGANDYFLAATLGVADVGIFRAGGRLVSAVGEAINEPVRMAAWAVLPRAQSSDGDDGFNVALSQTIIAVFAASAPAFVGLALLSEELVSLLLGERWLAAAPVLALLSFTRVLALLTTIITPVLGVKGFAHKAPFVTAATSVIQLCVLFAFGWRGVVWAAAAHLAGAFIGMVYNYRVMIQISKMPLGGLLSPLAKVAGSCGVMAVVVLLAGTAATNWPAAASIAVQIVAGVFSYCMAVFILRVDPMYTYAVNIFRKFSFST